MTTAYKRNGKFLGRIQDGVFVKDGVIEKKHLLHSYGDVPAIDKIAYEKLPVREIVIVTKKGRVFSSRRDNFEQNRIEIDYGYGKQYTMKKEHWNITVPVTNQQLF